MQSADTFTRKLSITNARYTNLPIEEEFGVFDELEAENDSEDEVLKKGAGM